MIQKEDSEAIFQFFYYCMLCTLTIQPRFLFYPGRSFCLPHVSYYPEKKKKNHCALVIQSNSHWLKNDEDFPQEEAFDHWSQIQR